MTSTPTGSPAGPADVTEPGRPVDARPEHVSAADHSGEGPHNPVDEGGGSVAFARPPADEPIRRLNFHERVAPSLWFVPMLFVAGAFVLSKVTVWMDRTLEAGRAPDWLLGADADAASALTATVATAMLSFVAVVFSTTLVAIQLAGGQYSPRVVRIFVRARLTHVTLGAFLATFVFALNGLVEVRSGDEPFVPTFTVAAVYLLLLATIVAFVTFVHGMSRMLRVQYLLTIVTADARAALIESFPDGEQRGTLVPVPPVDHGPVLTNHARVGVIQAVDRASLVEQASRAGVVLHLVVEVGEYVGVGTPVARVVSGPPDAMSGDDVTAWFLLGSERTVLHDPGFVFRQLVDVAARALSPAVNDPTTAVQVIDRVNDLLGDVAGRPDPSGWYLDRAGTPHLHLPEPGLSRLLLLAYVEIIRYGADSPQVVRRLRAAFDVLEPNLRPDVVPTLTSLRTMLETAVADSLPAAFRDVAAVRDRHGFG